MGEADPRNALVEGFDRHHEADQLRYVSWAQSTKRGPELLSAAAAKRPSSGFEEDARGYIKRVSVPVEAEADTSTDLLLHEALTRRGLAAEGMRLMTWGGVGDQIRDRIMEEIREPPPTPRHQRVTLEQAVRADEYIWVQLAKLAGRSGGIKPRPDGVLPLDLLVPKVGSTSLAFAGCVRSRGFFSADGPRLLGTARGPPHAAAWAADRKIAKGL